MSADRPRAEATLQIDNERLRVTLWRFAPGAATGWHRHEHDYCVVPLATGRLRIEAATGTSEAELAAGGSYYRSAGVEHDVINANDGPFAFVEIELKEPPRGT
jgi:quercetin dioxygenase-like cupin family protein